MNNTIEHLGHMAAECARKAELLPEGAWRTSLLNQAQRYRDAKYEQMGVVVISVDKAHPEQAAATIMSHADWQRICERDVAQAEAYPNANVVNDEPPDARWTNVGKTLLWAMLGGAFAWFLLAVGAWWFWGSR